MNVRTRTDVLLLVAFCGFLFFYGLGSFGLLGADEPRYAQVAREMLARHDFITPTLQGKPWLEKPVLYYWQAALAYRVGRAFLPAQGQSNHDQNNDGISDQAARLPSAFDAALLIVAVYLFLRRFRPGSQLDGALITAGCAGMIGFARAASTDMPLAAMFSVALLGWYAWHESRRRLPLAVFYMFLALATLAKGPVALFLALVILMLFAALKRDGQILLRTLWVPGIFLFLLIALPWYLAVEMRNPDFFRVFILQHNLARFSQNVYHHPQPFWFYLPVLCFGLMPWTLWLVLAVVEKLRLAWSQGLEAFAHPDDSRGLFLLLWLLVPVLFFSLSQSKLPGYILPSIPAGALLVSDYLAARRGDETTAEQTKSEEAWAGETKVPLPLAALHALACGALLFAALMAASVILNRRLLWGKGTYLAAAIAAVVAGGVAATLRSRPGIRLVRFVTMVPILLAVTAVLRLAAPAIDARLSARPIAQTILSFSHEGVPLAVYHTTREQEFGLEFYLNRPAQHYDWGQVPSQGHLLLAAPNSLPQIADFLPGRKLSYLTTIPAQNLELYWINPRPGTP
jgi:4-amino-4-deoxy-L-arabinose transferase-like glycosyltransferase